MYIIVIYIVHGHDMYAICAADVMMHALQSVELNARRSAMGTSQDNDDDRFEPHERARHEIVSCDEGL